ncbi:MAG: PD-(D/E)XK nuclease family protein [Pirellulaceae bacterium]
MTTSRLVDALAEVCRQHLLAEKWLLAPSLRVGHQWVTTVTRTGQPVVNVHIKTLKSIALDLAARDVSTNNLRLLAGRAGPMLIDRVFQRLKVQGLDYLGTLRASTGLAEVIYRSIQSVRMAGIDLRDVPVDRFEVADKGRDAQRIVAAYLEEIKESSLIDYADLLTYAIQRAQDDVSTLPVQVLVIVPEDLHARGLEQQLLQVLPAERRVALAIDRPVRETAATEATSTDLAMLRWLPRPGDAPPAVGDNTVEFFHAVGEVNEVREVLRRLVAHGVALDNAELLHTDVDTYVPLIYETLAALVPDDANLENDLPVTFADGIPARLFRPGRLLSAWATWISEDYPQARLVAIVREGLVATSEQNEGQTSSSRLATVLRGIGIGFGKDRYLPKLDEEITALKRRLAEPARVEEDNGTDNRSQWYTRRLEDLQALRRLVAAVLEVSPSRESSQSDILDSAIRMLETVARTVNKSDRFARQRLVGDITELRSWLGVDTDPAALDVWAWFSQLPSEARVLGSGPRPGCLHVASLLSGGHSGRDHTYIIGLDDGRFPGAGSQDPLLLDWERTRISDKLPTAVSQLEERVRDFHRLLARLRGKLTLSFASHDLTDDRSKFPGSLLLTAYRIISSTPEGSQEEFLKWLGSPVSFAPTDDTFCLDMKEWWLRQLCAGEPIQDDRQLVLRSFPHLARGDAVLERRASSDFTPYDGCVEQAGSDLDPTKADGPVMSSGRFEMIGQCPLKFFFRYGLEIQPPEELVLDPTRWLDPLTAGGMLHEVFEQFVGELIDKQEHSKYPDQFARLEAILQARVQVYRDFYPPLSEQVFSAQVSEFTRVIRTFLVEEAGYYSETGNRPAYLEASLGMSSDGEGSAIDTDQPIPMRLPDGETVHVRGRVDRIDEAGHGAVRSYVIWDYKTGSAWKYDPADPFREGRVVQPAVYVAMVDHCLRKVVKGKPKVAQFGFFFPGRRERGRRIQWTPDQLDAGPSVLNGIVDIVRSGAFLATNEKKDCNYCDYATICGDVTALTAASAEKLANADNTPLTPMRELRSDGKA